jgi:hypothetical protein
MTLFNKLFKSQVRSYMTLFNKLFKSKVTRSFSTSELFKSNVRTIHMYIILFDNLFQALVEATHNPLQQAFLLLLLAVYDPLQLSAGEHIYSTLCFQGLLCWFCLG